RVATVTGVQTCALPILDGVNWTAPFRVDNTPISDDYSNSFTRGNQFMPSLTFAAGKLMVLYYDLHLDHTLGAFAPAYSFSPDGRSEERRVGKECSGGCW